VVCEGSAFCINLSVPTANSLSLLARVASLDGVSVVLGWNLGGLWQ